MTPSGTNNNSSPELLRAINTLTKAIDNISKTFSSGPQTRSQRASQPGGNHPRGPGAGNSTQQDRKAQRLADENYERNKRLYKNQEKGILELSAGLWAFTRSMSKLGGEIVKDQKEYKKLLKMQNENARTLLENDKMGRRFQDRFVTNMSDVLKSTKSLQGKKLTATTTGGRIKEILGMQDSMNEVLTKVSGAKAKTGAKNVASMQEGNIKGIMKSLSDHGLTADGLGVDAFHKQLAGHNKKIDDKKKKMTIAAKSGNSKRAEMLKYELGILESRKADFLKDVGGKIDKSVSGIETFNRSIGKSTLTNYALSKSMDFAEKGIERLGGSGISVGSGLMILKKAFTDYAKYMSTLFAQQMGGAHWEIGKWALSMGSSVEATAKYFKQMMFQVSQLGFDKISGIIKNNKASLAKLGLFGDDALKAGAEFTRNLMLMGVHPKDEKKFNQAFANYSDRINQMAHLTGASVDELVAQDRALMNDAETQKMMMRLSDQQRAQKTQEILLEKTRIGYLIGSNEEAAKFIQTMQKVNGEKVDKRLENSVKMQQLMATVGLGADAGRMAAVMMKREDQLTKEDREFMSKTYMEIGKRTNQIQGAGGIGSEYLIDQLVDSQGQSVQAAIKAGSDAALSKDQKGSIDPNSKTAKAVEKTQQAGPGITNLMQMYTELQNNMGNPIIKLLIGIAGGIATIAAAMIMQNSKLLQGAKDFAKDKLDKLLGGPGNKAKTAAEGVEKAVGSATQTVGKEAAETAAKDAAKTVGTDVAKTAAKDTAKTVGKSALKKIPLLGIGAGLLFGAQRAMQGDWLGATGEVASGVAGTVPGLGTAASVGIDGLLLARDVSKAVDGVDATPTEKSGSTVNTAQVDNKQSADKINNETNDTQKKTSLEDLVNTINSGTEGEQSKMDEMIKLLKTLIETVNPENNGLLDAIKSGKGTGISFGDLVDKRSIFANK